MNFYLWIIRAEQTYLLASSAGISPSYVLPCLDNAIPDTKLAGSIIFTVLRGNKGDILFEKIFIKKVEKFVEEETNLANGQFLLSTDLLRSARIAKDYATGIYDFKIEESIHYPLGLSEISEHKASKIFDIVFSHIAQRFSNPSEKDLAFTEDSIPNGLNTDAFAIQLLKEIVKNYALGSLWGTKQIPNPFLNFAIHHLKRCKRHDEEEIVSSLKVYSTGIISINVLSHDFLDSPFVDVDFQTIDPDHLTARCFSAIDAQYDISTAMTKTEDAEKRHQEILKDICKFFIGHGIRPMQSSSIDLAILNNEEYIIFEIKTTSPQNIISQAGKGIFQLAIYSNGMISSGLKIRDKILVLESLYNKNLIEFITKSINSLGVKVIFYDSHKEWPDKFFPHYLLHQGTI